MEPRFCLYICICLCVVYDAVALKYNSCYAQPATSASIKRCNKTYHMEKELTARNSDDVCRLTKAFIQCLYDRVKYHCHDNDAADFITTAVRLLRQPKMDFHSCTLDSTLPRSSLLLLIAAVALTTNLSRIHMTSHLL